MQYCLGDWVCHSINEDGEFQEKLNYFIVAIDEKGNRWASESLNRNWIESLKRSQNLLNATVECVFLNPSAFNHLEIVAIQSLSDDQRLVFYIMDDKTEPPEDWCRMDPVYGSQAYESEEIYIAERERQDDLMSM